MYRVRKNLLPLVESGQTDWNDSTQRQLLRSVLMTTCDIAAITKPWDIQLRAANLVIAEFFDQGDKEKNVLKIQPPVSSQSIISNGTYSISIAVGLEDSRVYLYLRNIQA
jgi:3'5'-cyclic nucleotide phosphodiesterase